MSAETVIAKSWDTAMTAVPTRTQVAFEHHVIAPTPDPEDTLVLKLYGPRRDRDLAEAEVCGTIAHPHRVQHIWWPWVRPALLTRTHTLPPITMSARAWVGNLAVLAAAAFIIGIVVYEVAWGKQ